MTPRAASKPPSTKTAPKMASSASARIDGPGGAAPLLALAEPDVRREIERGGEPREHLAVDEVGAHARKVAFGYVRMTLVEDQRRRRS